MAEYANQDDSNKVSLAFSQAKKLMQADMSPTAALLMAAREHALSAGQAETIGHTLNQSIAGAVQLDDDPADEFDTADVELVKKDLLNPASGAAVETAEPNDPSKVAPVKGKVSNDFSRPALAKAASMEKSASANRPKGLILSRGDFREMQSVFAAVLDKYATLRAAAESDALSSIEKFASAFATAPDADRAQAALAMQSISEEASQPVFDHMRGRYGVDVDQVLSKEAALPAEGTTLALDGVASIYKIANLLSAQRDLSVVESDLSEIADDMQKVAEGGIFSDALETLGLTSEMTKDDPTPKAAEEIISPEATMRMKALDAEKKFYSMLLNDPDVGRYRPDDVLKARNSVVEINPDAGDKPYMLRSMVLDRLARGGLTDPMSLANEQKMHLVGLEGKKLRGEVALNAEKLKETRKANATKMVNPLKGISTAVGGVLETGADAAKKGLEGTVDLAQKGYGIATKAMGDTAKAVEPAKGGEGKPKAGGYNMQDLKAAWGLVPQVQAQIAGISPRNPDYARYQAAGLDPAEVANRMSTNKAGIAKIVASLNDADLQTLIEKPNKTQDERIAVMIAGHNITGDPLHFI